MTGPLVVKSSLIVKRPAEADVEFDLGSLPVSRDINVETDASEEENDHNQGNEKRDHVCL